MSILRSVQYVENVVVVVVTGIVVAMIVRSTLMSIV